MASNIIIPGDYVVFTDKQMDNYDMEVSLFKVMSVNANNSLTVYDVVDVYFYDDYDEDDLDIELVDIDNDYDDDYDMDDEYYLDIKLGENALSSYSDCDEDDADMDRILDIDASEVYKVYLTKLNLLKNYIINSSLTYSDSNEEGVNVCSLKVFTAIDDASSLEDAIDRISNKINGFFDVEKNISQDEDFEDMRRELVNTIEFLKDLKAEDVIEIYVKDSMFKFTEFDINKVI